MKTKYTTNNILVFKYTSISYLLSVDKTQSGLSNKGWDKGIKGLSKHGLTKVTKTDGLLIV